MFAKSIYSLMVFCMRAAYKIAPQDSSLCSSSLRANLGAVLQQQRKSISWSSSRSWSGSCSYILCVDSQLRFENNEYTGRCRLFISRYFSLHVTRWYLIIKLFSELSGIAKLQFELQSILEWRVNVSSPDKYVWSDSGNMNVLLLMQKTTFFSASVLSTSGIVYCCVWLTFVAFLLSRYGNII